MEPGLRDREYLPGIITPVVAQLAAMEPGLRDREYTDALDEALDTTAAAMEPGLRDREYMTRGARIRCSPGCCNGARS